MPEFIQIAVLMSIRFALSLRDVEDLLHERGIKAAVLKFLKKVMKGYGNLEVIVTDVLASYGAAMRDPVRLPRKASI